MRIHRVYVEWLDVPPVEMLEIGIAKLDMIQQYITEENAPKLLADGKALSKTSLRQELAVAFGADRDGPTDYRRWSYAWRKAAKKYRRWFKDAAGLPCGDFGKLKRLKLMDFSVDELKAELSRRSG